MSSVGPSRRTKAPVFKTYILSFVRSLGKNDRAAFRYWCIDIIPRSKLDINVADDGDFFKLIEFLQDDNQLSLTNMSLLKAFLSDVERGDLLEKLRRVEFRVAVGNILGYYNSEVVACDFTYIEEFLVATRENNQKPMSQALEQFKQVDDDSEALAILDNIFQDCQDCPWSTVTTLLVIMGELYSKSDSEREVNLVAKMNELFAKWMLKLGGLKAFEEFIRKKQRIVKITSHDCAMPSIGESLKEIIKSVIGHEVDTESSM